MGMELLIHSIISSWAIEHNRVTSLCCFLDIEALLATQGCQIWGQNGVNNGPIPAPSVPLWYIWLSICHDDVIKWKHFPRYWPFVHRSHQSPVNSLHKGQWRGALIFSLICVWINKRLSKQSWGWWFETLPHPLWRHSYGCCGRWRYIPVNESLWALTGLKISRI